MNNYQNYREYSDYQYQKDRNMKNSLRGSSYNQQPRPTSNQSPSPLYRPVPTANFDQPSYTHYRVQNQPGNRPPTPVYLREQSREDLYNKQLRQSIGNKLNLHNRNLPIFPMMDDQNSLASETMVRPSSFRPGSASNPDFMLPKDVQFYYKQKDKIFGKLEGFYAEEKKGIEEMMDECLKSIITLFEEHKQDLFKNLDEDKGTFVKVFTRFSEGVDNFLKTAESRLENNLKAYETRIVKIQEDDQNPLSTHIEKLRLEKEMINSKERIIREIKQSYEKSSIPWDKQKIGELMIDEYKKKHSVNVSNLAQHMQQMIGGLKKSIENFTTFKNYSTFEIAKEKPKNELKTDAQSPETGPGFGAPLGQPNLGVNPMISNLNQLLRQSNNLQFANAQNLNLGAENINQQMMLQNLAQMNLSPGFLNTADAYQMAMLKAQMGLGDPKSLGKLGAQQGFMNPNYNGAMGGLGLNGNMNAEAQSDWKSQSKNKTKSPKTEVRRETEEDPEMPKIRPAIKSPSQKLADLKKDEASDRILVNKKSVTFNLNNSPPAELDPQIQLKSDFRVREELEALQDPKEGPVESRSEFVDRAKDQDINEVIRKYKKIDQEASHKKKEGGQNERAKSPILEAKESVNQLNEIYANSRQKLMEYQNRQEAFEYSPKYQAKSKDAADLLRRESAPYKVEDSRYKLSQDPRTRLQSLQNFMDRSEDKRSNQFGKDLASGSKAQPYSNSFSKQRFNKDILKPKEKKKLQMDINRLGEKYGAGRNRPLSQNIKTIRADNRPRKSYIVINGRELVEAQHIHEHGEPLSVAGAGEAETAGNHPEQDLSAHQV